MGNIDQAVYSLLYKVIYINKGMRDKFGLFNRLGLRLMLNYSNRVDRRLIIKKPYEPDALRHFEESIRAEAFDLVLDIGANIGLYSLLAAKNGCKSIIAFEPHDRNDYQLKANVLLNNFIGLIEVHDYGLSDADGIVSFLKETGRNTGSSRIEATAPAETIMERYEKGSVKVRRFDDHFTYNGCKAFVKIDVEGHELNVVKGMKNFLTANKCLVQAEVFEDSLVEFHRYLIELGYRLRHEFEDDRVFANY